MHFANLSNYQAFYAAFYYLQDSPQAEKLMAVYGLPGIGKTFTLQQLAQQTSGIYYYCAPGHSPRSLCQDILNTCRHQSYGNSTTDHIKSVANYLSVNRLPLLLDDCDNLTSRGTVLETVRAIHDLSGQPVVMAGMTNFIQKLSRHSQILDRTHLLEFNPIGIEDVRKLTHALSEIEFTEDICHEIHRVCQGKARLAARSIGYVDNWVKAHGHKRVDLTLWGNLPLLPVVGGRAA